MFETLVGFGTIGGAIVAILLAGLAGLFMRTVVPTNRVHIVQGSKKTTSYGTGKPGGNVYYRWPSWVPKFGVTVIVLPVSNFDLSLSGYDAYDKDRVPFKVDVTAFFRIADTNKAAERVASYDELKEQLTLIVQGAVRRVLAGDVIDEIMVERSKFGDSFTNEVKDQLAEWGVDVVKAMELMDIRDEDGSKVIANIMAKKTSHIERESRVEVAENDRVAKEAEIAAQEAVDVRRQQAEESVGKRTADQEKEVGMARQKAKQAVLEEEKTTKEREMGVARVEEVERANIDREKQVVEANRDKDAQVIRADGELEAKRKEAEGLEAIGKAKGEAEKAMQLAPVDAQIKLADKIGANPGYQHFLAMVEAIKAHLVVGTEQAKALQGAEVKVIANSGNAGSGMNKVMDLFSSQGGTNLAAMVEALAQTPMGADLMGAIMSKMQTESAPAPSPESTAPAVDEDEVATS